MIFRVSILLVVSFLGALAYEARQDLPPKELVRTAVRKAVTIFIWCAVTYGVLELVTWLFIQAD